MVERDKAYLILGDGTIFEGESIGASGDAMGEAVFTTAMSGYIETLTDPSYFGQIVVHTFPMIGNYGAITLDKEGDKPSLSGYVVRELCKNGSNFRMESELDEYLKESGVVGIAGIDTRELTRKLREQGVMGAMITSSKKDIEGKLKKIRAFRIVDSVKNTSCKSVTFAGDEKGKRVVLMDFGAKADIERKLVARGCYVIRVPYNTSAEEILSYKPSGIMLSNGGGNPAAETEIIAEIRKLASHKIPIFGICLGHQLLALAFGARTKKLKYGHRGANQPVKDVDTGRVYITSQNHGYVVIPSSMPEDIARVKMINANDKTCEGIEYPTVPAFSVQFHPEGSSGPEDTAFLFDRFIEMMGGTGNAKE